MRNGLRVCSLERARRKERLRCLFKIFDPVCWTVRLKSTKNTRCVFCCYMLLYRINLQVAEEKEGEEVALVKIGR
ncbi:hypothetical protein [Carboxydothermus pertinax]|uniref:hypothetical protein n=1 Tax=Carboxydothermus pertinax TaxID=870242 RepID=UPI00096A311D|nr:hypothetical protein [Carboxydothermus pertinax]